MAILIPSPHLKHLNMTSGERRFAARLLIKLESDYHCWYDVPVGHKQLRPDFIVLHPARGILVLEVKDWKLDTIRRIDRQSVELLTDRGIKHVSNPLEQARGCAIEITRLLERDPILVEQGETRYKGHLLLPWGYGVVLTNISRQQFQEAQIDQAIDPGNVICSDEMHESVEKEVFQQCLWGMFKYHFGRALAISQIDRIRWHLFPEVRVEQGGLFAEAAPAATDPKTDIAETIPDLIKIMDHEQEKFSRNLGDGHRLIHGVAGSGKTMVLAYRAIHLARQSLEKPILLLCFNKALAARLRQLLSRRNVGGNVHVRHFHGWCKELCERHQLDLPTALAGEMIFDLWEQAVIAGAESGRVPPAQYSAMLIDEGHDFQAEWFSLIVHMLDPATDSLLLAYDDVQSIYKRDKPKSWASVGVKAKGRSTIFRVNYRNTDEALGLAYHFVEDYLDQSAATDDIPLIHPTSGLRHGARPEIRRYPNLAAEQEAIAGWFRKQAEAGISYRGMAVLCNVNWLISSTLKVLQKHGIPACEVDKDGLFGLDGNADAVNVMSVYASKGLEFHSVAIPNIGVLPNKEYPEADQARVLYVAMTRATEALMLTFHSESRFSESLRQERLETV